MSDWIDFESQPPDFDVEFQGWFETDDGDAFWEPVCILDEDRGLGIWGRVDYDIDGFDFGLFHLKLTHWMPKPEPPSNKT